MLSEFFHMHQFGFQFKSL